MKLTEMPILGPPKNTEKDYLSKMTNISGKKILCIGYSEAEVDEYIAKYHPGSIEVLTNLSSRLN